MRLKEKLQLKSAELYVNTVSRIERQIHGVAMNPFSAALADDPYAVHSGMRETRPIHYSLALRAWWVTRFDRVQEILRDKRFGADVRRYENRTRRFVRNMEAEQLETFNNPSMLDLDPPDHSRLRRLASQGFMHRFVQSLEPRIREIVEACLGRADNEEIIDIVEVLARPLPAIVIAEMMGLPESDHDQFQRWSQDLIDGTGTNDPDRIAKSRQAGRDLRDYFRQIAKVKRQRPSDDLVTRLIAAEESGDSLTETELYNTCLLLLVAGHETTTRLIGNGLHLLLAHPAQLEMLRNTPALIPQAIEEMLRFEPPVLATRRFATEDMDFHGTRFKRGDLIFVSIAGSNRDPRANDAPDAFDITRTDIRQISFGYGIHLCLGASLARLEAKVAFEELLSRYPRISRVDQVPDWGRNPFFRGLNSLRIRVGQGAPPVGD